MIDQTIRGSVAEYIENITSRKSLSSQTSEPIYFRDLEQYFIEKNIEKISEITPKDCEFLQSKLLKNKASSTVNRQFTLYNHFFKKCVEWNYLELSPTRFLKKKREFTPVRKLFSDEEIERILQNSHGWFYDAAFFLSKTGCRPTEMAIIKASNVFFDVEFTDINKNTKKISYVDLFSKKNGDTGNRIIILSDEVIPFVKRLVSSKNNPEELLFVTENKTQITTNRLNKRLRYLLKKINIPHKTIYSLRHTYLTDMCNDNKNLEIIRLAAGHKDIRTTLKYLKPHILDLHRAVNGD